MGEGTLDVSRVVEGTRVVVFGGTGFLGKLFWAMLVDRYPNIGKIFLVVRPKEKGTPEARFWSETAESEALEPLRRTHGTGFEAFLREKIVPIDGDMGRPLCGLDESLVHELWGSIDAVVNVAGVVDFNPPLDEGLHANAFGAQNLVGLARALGDVPCLSHQHLLRRGHAQGADPRGRPSRLSVPSRRRARGRRVGPSARNSGVPRSGRPGQSPLRGRLPSERVREHRPEEPDRSRRARARRGLRPRVRAREAQIREHTSRRGRPRPGDALGLAQHLHVHQGHRRAGDRVERAAFHHRASCVLRVVPRLPGAIVQRGGHDERAAALLDAEGAGARPREARAPRPHPDRLRRCGDDPRLRGAARGKRRAGLPVRRQRREPVHGAALRRARGHLQAQVLPAKGKQ